MRALRVSRAITPDELCTSVVPEPRPKAGEVLVRLQAAAVNHRDLHMFNWDPDHAFTLGSDGAGVVEAVGAGVEGWAPGAEVILNPSLNWGDRQDAYGAAWSILGWPADGTFAEAISIAASQVYPKPAHQTFEEAAALPLAGLTAFRALVSRAGLRTGERVLIHGIGGGAALFALQFARIVGARVMVTSTSAEKVARARELGAELGAHSHDDDWVTAAREWTDGAGVDVVVESVGGDFVARSLRALRRGGRLVSFGTTHAKHTDIDMHAVFWEQLSIIGSTMGSPADFSAMLALVNEHKMVPIVDSIQPLDEGCLALQRLAQGKQFGKVVLRIAQ